MFPLPNSAVEQVFARPHPFGEGRGGSGCRPVCASRGVDGGAHIPQERGGARGRVVAGGCGRVVVARVVARVVVVVEE